MIFELFLAGAVVAAGLPAGEVAAIAEDVRAVVLDEPPLFAGADARLRTGQLAIVWMLRESAGRADALGDCDDPEHRTVDTCRSFGAMQMNRMWLGARVAEVLGDRRLALRLALELMRELAVTCGSVRAGLQAYASGICSGSPRARALVAHRCAIAGGC